MPTEERIAEVGYINNKLEHAVVSVYHPVLLNRGDDFVQVVLSIEGAVKLRDNLDQFLADHYSGAH